MWHLRVNAGDLEGKLVGAVTVDPVRTASPVWLLDTGGGLWLLDNGLEKKDAPAPLKAIAALNDRDVLAIDADSQVWVSTSGDWKKRSSPGAPAAQPISVSGDGLGSGGLVTSDGRVFLTDDFGATFRPDPAGFGSGGTGGVAARKVCRTDRPQGTRFYWDTQGRVWRRNESEPNPRLVEAAGTVLDLAVSEDGILWMLKEGGRVFTSDAVTSLTSISGISEVFAVAPTQGGSAWAAKQDGTLWEFAPDDEPSPASGEGDASVPFRIS